MSRNEQATRILKVLHYLELHPRGLRAREILSRLKEDGFSCSRETVYRDLRALQESGVALENEADEGNGIWRIPQIAQVSKQVSFTYNELIALYIAKESLKSLRGSPLHNILEGFFVKLEKLLGEKARHEFERIAEHFSIRTKPKWASSVPREVLETLHSACAEGHVLEIEYCSASGENAGRPLMRKVGPVNLHFADSGGYLIAWDFTAQMYKTFALPRISRAEMLNEVFDDHGFDVDQFFKDQFSVLSAGQVETIELYVTEPIASYVIERQFHPSQKATRKEGGAVIELEMKVNDEVARFILSLGPAAQVLKPVSLAERVALMAEQIVDSYRKRSA